MKENFHAEREKVFEAGIAYSVAAVLPLLFSWALLNLIYLITGKEGADAEWVRYLSYLLPQIGIALSLLIFFRRTRMSPREVYRPAKWQYFPIAIALAFGLLSLSGLNGLFVDWLAGNGYQPASSPLPDVSGWYLLPALLVIALLPAIFEESLFRGLQTVLRREGWGTLATIFISGALFSLFHGNPEQTVYQFICGVCYALVAIRSGSVFPTMVAHFCNNALILTLTSFGIPDFPAAVKPWLYAISGVVLAAVLGYLIFFDKNNCGITQYNKKQKYFWGAGIGMFICAFEWVAVCIMGFGWI